eukprot:c6670_g1_i1.p1 GENE.c6670_g1_i1~~c6670_g1_i1.p1  ORF type:complete len:249 (+),score=41.55 c6670_g1_i1:43-747(+)
MPPKITKEDKDLLRQKIQDKRQSLPKSFKPNLSDYSDEKYQQPPAISEEVPPPKKSTTPAARTSMGTGTRPRRESAGERNGASHQKRTSKSPHRASQANKQRKSATMPRPRRRNSFPRVAEKEEAKPPESRLPLPLSRAKLRGVVVYRDAIAEENIIGEVVVPAGNTTCKEFYEKLITELGLEPNITVFKGSVQDGLTAALIKVVPETHLKVLDLFRSEEMVAVVTVISPEPEP